MNTKGTLFRNDDRADAKRYNPPQQSDAATNSKEARKQFDKIVSGSHRTLFRAKTVFPFTIFPDEVTIDENKVDIAYGLFFFSREVFSIPIQNINGVVGSVGLFFGSISVEIEGYNRNPSLVSYLRRNDALTARRIITGLVTTYRQNIDLSSIDLKAVREKLIEIGRAQELSQT